jgi:hypothetical protein
MSTDFVAPRRGWQLGTWSLVIGAAAIAIAAVTLTPYLMISKEAPDIAQSIAANAFLIGFVTISPLLHVIGFVTAIVSLFRPGESRRRGVFGLLVNSAAVAVIVGCIWILLTALAAFT